MKKEVDRLAELLQNNHRISDPLLYDRCVRGIDDQARRRLYVDRNESTVAVTQERRRKNYRAEALLGSGFYDDCRTKDPHERVPAQSPAVGEVGVELSASSRRLEFGIDMTE